MIIMPKNIYRKSTSIYFSEFYKFQLINSDFKLLYKILKRDPSSYNKKKIVKKLTFEPPVYHVALW